MEERSLMYTFLLNMWMMRKVNETFLSQQVTRGFITETELTMILATPQK